MFLIAGLLVGSGLRAVVSWIPWLAAVVGLGLIATGVAELRGVHVFARLPGVKRAARDRSLLGLVGFGASYGVASLSCTLPIFLSLVAGTVATGSLGQSIADFAAYGAGMSLVVITLTLALAAGRDRVLRSLRPIAARLGTISGWIMIIAGAFILWYWAAVLIGGAAQLGSNRVARFIENLTADLAGFVAANPLLTALGILAFGLIAWILTRPGRVSGSSSSEKKQVNESTLR